MKTRIFLSRLTIAFLGLALFSVEVNAQSSKNSQITFYETQLVCGAASDIGCGSRSKPILLDLEKNREIKEAWLNRPGTVIAVVWQDDVQVNSNLISSIFAKNKQAFELLSGKAQQEQLSDFKSGKWYQGAAVDELSMEEAGRIADKVVKPLLSASILSEKDGSKMHAEVETFIQNEFKTLKDVELLNSPAYYDNWSKEIKKIGEKYVGEGNMPEIDMRTPNNSSCCSSKETQDCTTEQTSCCTKPKSTGY